MKTITRTQSDTHVSKKSISFHCFKCSKFGLVWLSLFTGMFFAIGTQAQTVTFKSVQLRATVPLGFNGSLLLSSNLMTIRTNGASLDGTGTNWVINPINVSVTGAPSGVTATPVDGSLNPVTSVPVNLNTNNTSTSTNLIVQLNFNGSEKEGVSTLSLNAAGGATDNIFLTLQVGAFWTGATNVSTSWSSTASWLAGVLPTNVDDVQFTQLGAQTN